MSDYIDNILVKLKRKYGKDELVASLIKENNELKNKNTELNLEIIEARRTVKRVLGEQKGLKNTIEVQKQTLAKRNAKLEELYIKSKYKYYENNNNNS